MGARTRVLGLLGLDLAPAVGGVGWGGGSPHPPHRIPVYHNPAHPQPSSVPIPIPGSVPQMAKSQPKLAGTLQLPMATRGPIAGPEAVYEAERRHGNA